MGHTTKRRHEGPSRRSLDSGCERSKRERTATREAVPADEMIHPTAGFWVSEGACLHDSVAALSAPLTHELSADKAIWMEVCFVGEQNVMNNCWTVF
jgi:hypothetical protein